MKLALPSVALCCIDTRFPELAEYSLHRSIEAAGVEFGEVLLFTSAQRAGFARRYGFPLKIVEIGDLGSKTDYSHFVIRELPAHVRADHALITQWDSFVVDAQAWRPEFLEYDYLGAVWHWMQGPLRVGNGGFSLRSRRLMDAAAEAIEQVDGNEDVLICRTHRGGLESRYGIRFGDEATAASFAFERAPPPDGRAFGFHGLFNFDRVLPAGELARYVEALPGPLALTVEGAELAVQLFNSGRHELAKALVRRRLATDPGDEVGTRLAVQMEGQPAPPQRDAASAIGQTPAHDGFNADVLQMMPPNLARVVEVGSSRGALAAAYRQSNPSTEYIGIEIDAGYAERSRARCSRVVHANIEEMSDGELQGLLPADCWVFADVLEHLYDPWRLLKRLRSVMRASDCVVACIPNTQHWSVVARLISGNFWYEDLGLLDRTHIRFFTRATMIKMFEDSGFRIESGRPRIFQFEHQERVLGAIRTFAQSLGMDPERCALDATVFQHVVRAYPV